MAGVKNIQIWFETNLTYSYVSGDGSQYSSNLLLNQGVYDSWGDGYSSCTWYISGTNKTGVYNIARVIVEDLQGNSRIYSPVELTGMGVGTIIWMVASKTILTSAGDGFTGTQYADWISGREGNDNLHGLNGDDYIRLD